MTGKIFDIKHFGVHDGPGIRTTVFLKGCPLKCLWCHNPESISPKFQLSYLDYKCVGCGRCAAVCEQGVHIVNQNGHTVIRKNCIYCGKCEKACSAGALTVYGREITVEDAFDEVMEDADFYAVNGGMTLSGGEALMQPDFCLELLKKAKENGIHTAIDTCGFVKKDVLDKVIPYTDLFLYDIKAFDENVHIKCTGVSNKIILENIRYLNEIGKEIEVRIPFVPEYNCDQIEKIAQFLAPLKMVKAAKVLAYHNYAKSKYASLDMPDTSPEVLPTSAELEKAREILRAHGIKAK